MSNAATYGEGNGEWWIWNDLEWNGHGPNWSIVPWLRKTTEPLSYYCWPLGLSMETSEHKAWFLTVLIVIIGLWNYCVSYFMNYCMSYFMNYGMSYFMNVKACYWLKIVPFPFSDIQTLYKFSVLVGYCAKFMVYPSGFWCFVPINRCYSCCQVEVTLMPAVNISIWTKIDCLCLSKDSHLS